MWGAVQRVRARVTGWARKIDLDKLGALVFVGTLLCTLHQGVSTVALGKGTAISDFSIVPLVLGASIGVATTSTFHFIEDTYFNESTPIIGSSFIKANRLHHAKPKLMACHSIWKNVGFRLWLPISCLNLYFQNMTWFMATSEIVIAIWVHRWIHDPFRPNPVQKLMDWGILPTMKTHRVHHENDAAGYVIFPAFLDRILDRVKFWRGVEFVIWKLTGVVPRTDKHHEPKSGVQLPSGFWDSPSQCT